MRRKHDDFRLPEDCMTANIWRYMKVHRFIDLLTTGEIFFARADTLEDRNEGAYSSAEVKHLLDSRLAHNDQRQRIITATERISEETCKSVAVNCWCLSENERSLMWQAYVGQCDGVAIGTTVQGLIEAFEREHVQPIYVGTVRYINYYCDRMNAYTGLAPFVHKSYEFSDEHELRAVTQALNRNQDLRLNVPERDYFTGGAIDGKGIRVSVHLDKLVQKVRIAPFASEECVDYVHAAVRYYLPNVRHSVTKSILFSRHDCKLRPVCQSMGSRHTSVSNELLTPSAVELDVNT